ncbi:hypothetical protein R3P38DRAFT_2871972 [Favolaschia claudopus]|uniref:F-box domain-containing protein n=1 Tax=Favolaschia claudopus TaxID=2862362 RepID=A0AAW0DC34_9AGAR
MSPSDAPNNPLDVQELLDLCIDGVANSTRDLLACSVVAHRWRDSAQSHLFRAPHTRYRTYTNNTPLAKLLAALTANPSLLHHVRELHLVMHHPEYRRDRGHESTLNAICQLPFPSLECLEFITWWSIPDTFPLILGLPTLRDLRLIDRTPESSAFRHSWKHCGPSVTHLELVCGEVLTEASDAAAERQIPLKSIRFTLTGSSGNIHSAMFAPLDLSQVKAFSINGSFSLLWNKIGLGASLQVLEIDFAQSYGHPLDLSPFLHLSIFRIKFSSGSRTISTLSASLLTLASANPSSLRTIILTQRSPFLPEPFAFDTLDSALCSCAAGSKHPDFCVYFEISKHTSREEAERMFPGVAGRGTLRLVEQPIPTPGDDASRLWWRMWPSALVTLKILLHGPHPALPDEEVRREVYAWGLCRGRRGH